MLTSDHVTARWDRVAGTFQLSSLMIEGEQAIAAGSFTTRDYQDHGGLWRLGHEMSGCSFTPIAAGPATDTVQVQHY